MSRFGYVKAASISRALDLMAENPGYSLIAGGTDLIVRIRDNVVRPTMVIDITEITGLQDVRLVQDRLVIGAAVTHTALSESALVRRHAPALAEAAGLVGSPQIRNRGTVGGNMGNASPAADTVPALMVLNAVVTIAGPQGNRQVGISDFFTGPGRTVLAVGEMVTEISVPTQQAHEGSSFQKLGKRKAQAISVVNAAAFLAVDRLTGKVTQCRLSLGSVAPTVVRAREAERHLLGKVMTSGTIAETGKIGAAAILPIDDIRSTAVYRREVAGVLIARAIQGALSRIDEGDRP